MASRRIGLLVLVLGLSVAAGYVVFLSGDSKRRNETPLAELHVPQEKTVQAAELKASAPQASPIERVSVTEAPVTLPPVPELETNGDYAVSEEGPPDQALLRLHVHGPSGPLAGVSVRAQSWLEDTEETFFHTVETDKEGFALFRFDEATHVDWLYCAPPAELALGATMLDYHEDIALGSIMDAWMEVEPAARVRGTVQFEDGSPASGVEVHAYVDYFQGALEAAWRPGVFTTRTAFDGSYVFENMPARDWYIGVPPFDWVQLYPPLTQMDQGTYADLAPDTELDLGVLRVAPLREVALTVLPAGEEPLPQLSASLTPVDFLGRSIVLAEEDFQIDGPYERWLGGQDPAGPNRELGPTTPWLYEALYSEIGTDGSASFPVVEGSWELTIWPSFGAPVDDQILYRAEVMPGPPLTIRLNAASGSIAGRFVTEDGQPVRGARASLRCEGKGWSRNRRKTVDADGRFTFAGLPLDAEYKLFLQHGDFLPGSWEVAPGEASEDYVARRGATLRLKMQTPSGDPAPRQRLTILGASPKEASLSAGDQEQLRLHTTNGASYRWDANGDLHIQRLVPGTYELGIKLAFATGEVTDRGYRITEERVWQRWTVSTDEPQHVLTVDLTGYEAPRTPQAVHTGTVHDAVTGERVVADVRIVKGSRVLQNAWSNGGGDHFDVRSPAGEHGLLVLRAGFEPYRIPSQSFPEGRYSHDIQLVPDPNSIVLRVTDKHGDPLPGCRVKLVELDESPRYAFFENGTWRYDWFIELGAVKVAGLGPGEHRAEVSIDRHELGTFSFRISGGTPEEPVSLVIDKSQDELREWIQAKLAEDN